ncbi:hypothetical protein BP5796_09519 [Coleophoma crateriformis]|uniref:PARP-type domain-containing protein n=1 Tax=Coleophoma crateriformis TaxID=565419 RepID=A0A3D8QYM5_9HELO|nr:hypothetical protein BP5796_09519 [Coleophoma crateriformis]
MVYRVEVAVSGRAGCKATECKHAGIKIEKGELRVGTWVEIGGHGSWQWRHWGCMTGKMLENLRHYLEGEDNKGSEEFRWDYLDGLEGEAKGDLTDHPELQEKVKRVVKQGFIDPEDWKGDPEMNQLGLSGLRTAETKKMQRDAARAAKAAKAEADGSDAEPQSSPPPPTASKKRAKGGDTESEDEKPAKKKRGTKAKKEEDDEDAKPVKNYRAKVKKEEYDTEDDIKPTKKSRAKKIKDESEDEEEDIIPAMKSRAKKVKKEEEEDVKPAKRSRAAKVQEKELSSSPEVDSGEPDFSKLSVSELKEELNKRGLSKTGKKAELLARLEEGAESGSELEPSDDNAMHVHQTSSSPTIKKQEEEKNPVKDELSDAFDMDEVESKPKKAGRRKM